MAEFLYGRLAGCGYEVWKDDHNLPLGTSFPRAISDALEKKGDFILLVTSAALRSDWVNDEVNMAMTARRRVIPVVLDNNLRDDEIPLFLRKINWLRMKNSTNDWESLNKLVDNLEAGETIPRVINMSGHKDIEVKGILVLGDSEFEVVDLTDPKAIVETAKKAAEAALPFINANAGIVPHGHPALACAILAHILGTTTRMPNLLTLIKRKAASLELAATRFISLQSIREMGFEYRSHL